MGDVILARTVDDILNVPGNRNVYSRLRTLLAERHATAFVGAGASAPLYPLWTELITSMADAAVAQVGARPEDREFWIRNASTDPLQIVRQLRQQLQEPRYFAFLYDTFKLKIGPDGHGSTAAHRALLALGFKAFITTNYDEGLVQARHVVRPQLRDTSFIVWNQNFPVNRWASGDIFGDADACPILFAHGHYADPESLVLDRDSYRRAYHGTPFQRLMKELWHREHLVFAGFSFKDEVLKQVADQDLWETVRQGGGAPRHVAILGLDVDVPFSPEMRRLYEDQFFADVLFYPVTRSAEGRPDHGALVPLLSSLQSPGATATIVPAPTHAAAVMEPASAAPVRSRFVHESTEDEKFTGRDRVLARLDVWVDDPSVSIVAISAIGGTGKTALLATWMRRPSTAAARAFRGIFFWSFYREHRATAFLQALVDFGRDECGWHSPSGAATRVEQGIDLIQRVPILIGLDGLEVIQEDPGGLDYGKVLDHDLAEFLDRLAYTTTPSFAVLTSRYPFPDLTPFLGNALRILPLSALEPEEGARLLRSMGVLGDHPSLVSVSERLEGHPLALRLFARSMPRDAAVSGDGHWEAVFSTASPAGNDPIAGKMMRLLNFYSEHLPAELRDALSLVALFRTPIAEAEVAPLWREVLNRHDQEPSLGRSLAALRSDHLLTADVGDDGVARYAAHPILRDHFRALLLGDSGFATNASELLSSRPSSTSNSPSAESLFLAAELLFAAGYLRLANDVLGRDEIFFTTDYRRFAHMARLAVESLDQSTAGTDGEDVGPLLFGVLLMAELGLRHLGDTEQSQRVLQRLDQLAVRSQGSDSETTRGAVALAAIGAALAQGTAGQLEELVARLGRLMPAFTYYARFLELAIWGLTADSSRLAIPTAASALASESGSEVSVDKMELATIFQLFGGLTSFAIEALIQAGEFKQAKWLIDQLYARANESDRLPGHGAVADYLRAWMAALEGDHEQAHAFIRATKPVFLKGPMVYELAKLHLVEARLALAEHKPDIAHIAAKSAMRIAGPRKYRPVHADALNLRASAALMGSVPDAGAARDDAEAALHLSEVCSYRWAERDAYALLAVAARHLQQPDEAARWQKRYETLRKQLILPSGFSIIPPSEAAASGGGGSG